MATTRVLALVGSLRTDSVNRKIAETAVAVATDDVDVVIFEGLGDLPFYNEDVDVDGGPAAAQVLRMAAAEADALLLVTPEFNGTVPAVLSNAIDWLSRPFQAGAIYGAPVAVISASPSPNGARWAHDDTRKAVGIAGGRVLEDISLSVGGTMEKFGAAHPSANAEVSGQVAAVVRELVVAAGQRVAA